MDTPLPSNDALLEFSESAPWREIEQQKRRLNERLKQILKDNPDGDLPLDELSDATGCPVTLFYSDSKRGNLVLGEVNGRKHLLGSFVSQRYRSGQSERQSFVPYNLNPSVNHTNIQETDTPLTRMRALGAELELGLLHPDGRGPTEAEVIEFINIYREYAHRFGITPQVDREACQYQIEVHVAPGIGYSRTRHSLDGIMSALVATSQRTGLQTAIVSVYPVLSDFKLADNPKVQTAVDLMIELNAYFDEYVERQNAARKRYNLASDSNVVQIFRLQGCHIHLDLAGRSEALGLLAFHTMLRSATSLAGYAVLKGGPFVNGTCDADLLCVREYLRSTTVTGRHLEVPLSPHFAQQGFERFGGLIQKERANASGRAHLYEDGLGEPISAMHNPLGRVRSDLKMSKRICTLEATGLPVNISASRMAAILTDFAFSHVLIENYFRNYGLDLNPMHDDQDLWAILGPLSTDAFNQMQAASDKEGTDALLTLPTGEQLTLSEFYERKRIYMHRHLAEIAGITPRDIDDVYMSLQRMLAPPSGRKAETIEQYITDPILRSTGNWGRILRDAFVEEGGTLGEHNPDVVLAVTKRVHAALCQRYGNT